MSMLLEKRTMTDSLPVRPVPLDAFWAGSRWRRAVAGLDLKNHVKGTLDEMGRIVRESRVYEVTA